MPSAPAEPKGQLYRFNPWVTIAADGTVVITIDRSEMGQGVNTSLAMLVAEELDVPLEGIRTQFAPVDHVYDDPVIGMQITVGSMSVHNAWLRLRSAGADARLRLIAAAAKRWDVRPEECRTEDATVIHDADERRAGYGDLAAAAAALEPFASPPLRGFDEFHILGKPAARLEIPAHVAGRTVFGMDVALPGMQSATLLMPAVLGSVPASIDATAAKAIPGVRDVFEIRDGIAVVGDDLWSAFLGREALRVAWTRGNDDVSTAQIEARLQTALQRPGEVTYAAGQADDASTGGASSLAANYATPYVAHAPIEPINCTVRIGASSADVWLPTQGQTLARAAAAQAAGLPLESVAVHTTFLGGGFGRRSVPDVVTQAVQIAQRTGTPIQLVWTRSDDIEHDRYRPASRTIFRAQLDAAGNPIGLFGRIAGPKLAFDGVSIPYGIPNVRIECVEEDPGVPVGYWRSVGASQNAFAIESFIDELADAAHADPVAFRLGLLGTSSRHRAVLELAANKAGWGTPVAGRSRGIAVYDAHGGWVAEIAEVSVREDGGVNVHRVVCAVDCGFAVKPDTVEAQIEGGVAFGITAALKSSITLERGRVVQTGFRDFPLLTIADMPAVEVHILPSREAPSGAGECGVPPVAPAIANAIFAATGRRLRSLPLHLGTAAAP